MIVGNVQVNFHSTRYFVDVVSAVYDLSRVTEMKAKSLLTFQVTKKKSFKILNGHFIFELQTTISKWTIPDLDHPVRMPRH